MGYRAAADRNVRSQDTMYFVPHAQGEYAHGRWLGLSDDSVVRTLARIRGTAQAVMARLLGKAGAPA